MTYREFYVAVAEMTAEDNTELCEFANKAIQALDSKNEKRKSLDSKEKKEVLARKEKIYAFLCEHKGENFNRDDIASFCDVTPGQATSACSAFVKDGLVTKSEVKDGKTKKMVYSLATETKTTEE